MELKVKLLNDSAKLPAYAKPGDFGLDLTATSKEYDSVNDVLIFGTGLSVEIPVGHVGFIFPRSSVYKTGLSLANSVGCIDAGFRGEIKVLFYTGNRPKKNYEVGDRIAQLAIIPFPYVNIKQVDELSETERGSGGFGSSGK
jgi:dUTP pyrophosphatase